MKRENINNIDPSTRGFYTIALFTMYVNGDISAKLSDMNIKDRGTFVHEYIHYIQNISTITGLRFSSFYISFIIRLIKWLKQQDTINIPINIADICTTDTLKSDYLFFNLTTGDVKIFDFDINQDIMWNFDFNKREQLIHFNIKTLNDDSENLLVGSYAIKESMAALYQSLIDPSCLSHMSAYPYKFVKYIVHNLFPEIESDTKKLICICHVALNSPTPVYTLLQWLVFAHNNPELNGLEIYNEYVKETGYAIKNGDMEYEKYSIKDLLSQSVNSFTSKLKQILLNKENSYSAMIQSASNFSDIHLRILYHNDNLIKNIEMMMQVCGVPFVYNDNGDKISLSLGYKDFVDKSCFIDKDLQFILSLSNLTTSLLQPKSQFYCRCLFRTMFCIHQYNDDEIAEHVYCFDEPWKEKNCNYWKMLNMLELDNKKFII